MASVFWELAAWSCEQEKTEETESKGSVSSAYSVGSFPLVVGKIIYSGNS